MIIDVPFIRSSDHKFQITQRTGTAYGDDSGDGRRTENKSEEIKTETIN